ncbi:hypothetical protein J4206_00360 [Candidatus Woesearchaeota archaeon]|nr:hypothetical protein [Candidatus Woesearchaeota archaeon]
MEFEDDKAMGNLGEKTGFIFSYFLFTTALFFMLQFTRKIPVSWSYFHIMAITLSIVFLGHLIERKLK